MRERSSILTLICNSHDRLWMFSMRSAGTAPPAIRSAFATAADRRYVESLRTRSHASPLPLADVERMCFIIKKATCFAQPPLVLPYQANRHAFRSLAAQLNNEAPATARSLSQCLRFLG